MGTPALASTFPRVSSRHHSALSPGGPSSGLPRAMLLSGYKPPRLKQTSTGSVLRLEAGNLGVCGGLPGQQDRACPGGPSSSLCYGLSWEPGPLSPLGCLRRPGGSPRWELGLQCPSLRNPCPWTQGLPRPAGPPPTHISAKALFPQQVRSLNASTLELWRHQSRWRAAVHGTTTEEHHPGNPSNTSEGQGRLQPGAWRSRGLRPEQRARDTASVISARFPRCHPKDPPPRKRRAFFTIIPKVFIFK